MPRTPTPLLRRLSDLVPVCVLLDDAVDGERPVHFLSHIFAGRVVAFRIRSPETLVPGRRIDMKGRRDATSRGAREAVTHNRGNGGRGRPAADSDGSPRRIPRSTVGGGGTRADAASSLRRRTSGIRNGRRARGDTATLHTWSRIVAGQSRPAAD